MPNFFGSKRSLLKTQISSISSRFFTVPFSLSGPWNVPISNNGIYQTVSSLNSLIPNLSSWESTRSSIPIYNATKSDPQVNILYNANSSTNLYNGTWKSNNNTTGVETSITSGSSSTFPDDSATYSSQVHGSLVKPEYYNKLVNSPKKIYCPSNVVPERGADSHLVIYQPDGTFIDLYGAIILSSGDIVCLYYIKGNPSLAGDGWTNGTTASMLPSHAGVIKQSDIDKGSIDHAIRVTIPANLLVYDWLYPAYSFDRNTVYSGLLPMGSRLALDSSKSVASLGLGTTQGTMIATAAKKYGFIVCDSNGGGITLNIEEGITDSGLATYNGPINQDLITIMSFMRFVQVPHTEYQTNPPVITNRDPNSISLNWRTGFTNGKIPNTTSANTVIADIVATDPESDSITFSKLGDPNNKFSVSGNTLVLSSTVTAGSTHLVSIKATDTFTNKLIGVFSTSISGYVVQVTETFESGTRQAYWSGNSGTIDATSAVTGTYSNKTVGSQEINKTGLSINSGKVKINFNLKLSSSSTATTGQKTRVDIFKRHPDYINLWLSKTSTGFLLTGGTTVGAMPSNNNVALLADTIVAIEAIIDITALTWSIAANSTIFASGSHTITNLTETHLGPTGFDATFTAFWDDIIISVGN